MHPTPPTYSTKTRTLATLALLTLLISPFIGMEFIAPTALFSTPHPLDHTILIHLRIPRTITAFLTGASLGLCGLVFQSIFRNPLATPYTLGVSSGAALGATLSIALGIPLLIAGLPALMPIAALSAILTMLFVYTIASLKQQTSNTILLLAGVSVNLLCASLILFIQFISNERNINRILRWLMGSLSSADYISTLSIACIALPVLYLIYRHRNELDLLLNGDDIAQTRGVDIIRTKRTLYFSASLLTGVLVAFCGPIGFVGIITPHIVRRLFSVRHATNIIPVACTGGILLTVCDTIARTAFAPAELPVGIITSMLGGPFFLYILLKHNKTYQGDL